MPPQPQYLSTDPNAGQAQQYLSTDPNAGEPVGKSVSGFVSNVGQDLGNTAKGLLSLLNPMTWARMADERAQTQDAEQTRSQALERQLGRKPTAVEVLRNEYPSSNRQSFGQNLADIPTELPRQIGEFAYERPVTTALMATPGRMLSRGATAAATTTGRGLANLGPRAVQAAVKPTVSELRRQSGASTTGLQGQANRVTGMLLRNRWTTPEQAANAIRETEQKIQAAVATNPNANVQPLLDTASRVPRYVGRVQRSASRQAIPSADVATIGRAGEGVLEGPLAQTVQRRQPVPGLAQQVDGPAGHQTVQAVRNVGERRMRANVTPEEGLEIARATGRWGNRKAWGELKGAEQEASKAAERAIRDSVKEAVPEARPLLQQQGEALTLYPILDRMALRQANRDVVGLPAWATAGPEIAAGNIPWTGMAAQFMRNQQLPLGYAAYDVGNLLTANAGRIGAYTPESLRLALLAALTTEEAGR